MPEAFPARPDAAQLLDAAPGGIFGFDATGTLQYVNATLARYLRIDGAASLLGQSVDTLLTLPTRIFFQTHFMPLLKLHGAASEIFLTLAASDGEPVPVVANAARLPDVPELYQCVVLPVYHRQQLEDELVAARRHAEQALRSNSALEQLRATLETNQAQLDRRMARLEQHNEALRQLNWLLAHDLQEPLRKIQLFASLLDQRQALGPDQQPHLQRIVDNVVSISELIADVQRYIGLDFDHEAQADTVVVDLNAVIRRVARTLRERYSDRDWTLRFEGDLPTIVGAEAQLELLFYQLLDNAIKFAPPAEPARIAIDAAVVEHNRLHNLPEVYRYTDFVRITVRDHGPGFHEASLRNDLLFRLLKKADRTTPGSGIGLALCKKIVGNHYGMISARNAAEGGAEVTVWLPVAP